MEFMVYLVRKDLKEIAPRRAMDRANATGQWSQHLIPVMPRKRWGYKSETAALNALDRFARKSGLNLDEWRGLVWLRGRENEPALTVAV